MEAEWSRGNVPRVLWNMGGAGVKRPREANLWGEGASMTGRVAPCHGGGKWAGERGCGGVAGRPNYYWPIFTPQNPNAICFVGTK